MLDRAVIYLTKSNKIIKNKEAFASFFERYREF